MYKVQNERYEFIKKSIADLIEDYGLLYPLDISKLLEVLNIDVIHVRSIEPISGFHEPTDDGYTRYNPSNPYRRYEICLNVNKPRLRQRFTLAHELGHIWLDHHHHSRSFLQEIEANYFSAYLLAPSPLLDLVLDVVNPKNISTYFQVSTECATNIFADYEKARQITGFRREYERRIVHAYRQSNIIHLSDYQCRLNRHHMRCPHL